MADKSEQSKFKDKAEEWGNSLLGEMSADNIIVKDTNTFSFAKAYKYIKDGKQVSRYGWDNPSMWIVKYNRSNNHYKDENLLLGFEDFIVMMTTEGKYVPWTPSQTDLLTEDWILI